MQDPLTDIGNRRRLTTTETEEVPTLPEPVAIVRGGDEHDPPPRRHPLRQRLITYVLAMFVLINLNFLLPRALPGDPIGTLFSSASPTYVYEEHTRAELVRYYGLDGSLVEQYGHYLSALARGDLGVSIRETAPIRDLLLARFPWTALLVGTGMVLAAAVGLAAGVHSAWHRGGAVDRRLLASFLVVSHLPTYLLASLALLVFAVKLRWSPLSGGRTPFMASSSLLDQAVDIARHLALPALVMATAFIFFQYLVMRGSMVSELGSDYLLGGRAKGLSERRLKYRYAARNAMLPVVTAQALQLRVAVGVGIFVEQVFAYPGVGLLLTNAVNGRDYPLMQGAFLVLMFAVLTANLGLDLVYERLDPRSAA